MSAFSGLFLSASPHAAAGRPDASIALIALDLAAGGWLLVGLAAASIAVLFLCRDRGLRPKYARHLAARPRLGSGWVVSQTQRQLAHP